VGVRKEKLKFGKKAGGHETTRELEGRGVEQVSIGGTERKGKRKGTVVSIERRKHRTGNRRGGLCGNIER